jgi:hypothetical protein
VTVLVEALRKITPADQAYLIDDLFNHIVLYENHAISASARRCRTDATKQLHRQRRQGARRRTGRRKDVPLRDWIEVGVDDKDGNSLLRERKLITHKEKLYTVIVSGRPAKAGIDPTTS